MIDKKALKKGLEALEKGVEFQIAKHGNGWDLFIQGSKVAELTDQQRNYIYRDVQGYEKADQQEKAEMDKKVRAEVELAVRYLLITPSIPTNLDAAAAELIMGWTRQADQPGCGCLTYRAPNGATHYVAKKPESGCQNHQVWSPSTHLPSTQELFEKPFLCLDGRYLAIQKINTNFNTTATPPGQPVVVTNKDILQARTVVTFRNAARTETFDVVDEQCVPPAAVCIAALKQMGVNIQVNK